MMKTRLARTVARLDTASTTALRSRTTLPASSAVSAVTQATWLAIARIASAVLVGATTTQWAGLVLLAWEAVVAATPWTANTRFVNVPSRLPATTAVS